MRPLFGTKSPYYLRVRNLFHPPDSIAYWPMFDTTAPTMKDYSGNDRNGAYGTLTAQPTLSNMAFDDGKKYPYFDASDYGNCYSASFRDAFNGASGSVFIWAKVYSVGVWTDATYRYLFSFQADTNNKVCAYRSNANNRIDLYYVAGSVATYVNVTGLSSTGWLHFGITWSHADDQMKVYYNGMQFSTTKTGLGDWVGNVSPSNCVVGASTLTPSQPWYGYLAHLLVLNRAATAEEVTKVYTL